MNSSPRISISKGLAIGYRNRKLFHADDILALATAGESIDLAEG
ncbi:MAG: hypothetical protein ACI8UO_004253, partial [Verrucomicrobiales bacterium]